jgi:hypothetical protein
VAANTRITPTATGAVVHSGVSGAPDVVAVALTDGAGNVIKTTDNGDGTATLASSATIGAGSTVKILDSAGTNVAAVSAAGAIKVDGSAATQPVSAATLPLPTGAASAVKQPALGTAGAASVDVLSVQGIASMTALKTDSSATTQPVSAATLPLPTGASSAAKQPALGTAGSASADVLSVQGIASMTALKVDGSAVTQPVSAASLPLPTGAATAARQAAPGTAGTASADVLSVQGIASMTALKTDGSATTQPVSGTVTANAGTNLNTSALALDATLTGGTQQAKLTDGTNIGHVLKSDGTAAGQNAQLVAGGHLTVAFTTTTVQAVAATDVANYSWVSVHINLQGTSSLVAFQTSNDNTNWTPLALSLATGGGAVASSSATAAATYHGPTAGRYFRLNITGISAATTSGTIEFFTVPRAVSAVPVSQLGTWTLQPGNTANTTPWLTTPAAGTTGGYSFNNITTATTTTVKSGAGTFHALVINTKGSASTATIYDSTTGSGTKIATVDTSLGTSTILYDVAFTTGLTIVTVATADITAVFK